MRLKNRAIRLGCLALAILMVCLAPTGCSGPAEYAGLGAGVTLGTLKLGTIPSSEVEQIYYLGVFDPQEQVPPAMYRVRVHGQASAISGMSFASGWVNAALVDSLGSKISTNMETGKISIEKTDSPDPFQPLTTGRQLMMFGPEGFRKAPKDHRLVIVMGSSPEKYFQAIDTALGTVSEVMVEQRGAALSQELFEALYKLKSEHDRLTDLEIDIATGSSK